MGRGTSSLEDSSWPAVLLALNWPTFVLSAVGCIGTHMAFDSSGPSMRWPFVVDSTSDHPALKSPALDPAIPFTTFAHCPHLSPTLPSIRPVLSPSCLLADVGVSDFPYFETGTIPYSGMVVLNIFVWSILMCVGEQLYTSPSVSMRRRAVGALQLTLGFGEAMFCTNMWTEIGKNWVGEVRPDFQNRCTKDGVLDQVCHKGRMSFPSGHASMAVCMGTWTTAYLVWSQYVRDVRMDQPPARELISCRRCCWGTMLNTLRRLLPRAAVLSNFGHVLPAIAGLYVCASRVAHFRHNSGDVCAGAILGALVCATTFVRATTGVTRLLGTASEEEAAAGSGGDGGAGVAQRGILMTSQMGSRKFGGENPIAGADRNAAQ